MELVISWKQPQPSGPKSSKDRPSNAKRTRAGRPVLINAGSGARGGGWLPPLFDGWEHVRVDVDPAVRPDLVANVTDLYSIPTGCADAVWSAHCIEHLFAHEVLTAIGEFRRGPVTAHDMVWGFGPAIERGDDAMAHRCGFTPRVFLQRLSDGGFAEIVLRRRANLELAGLCLCRPSANSEEREAVMARLGL